jgi:hypothetical protein
MDEIIGILSTALELAGMNLEKTLNCEENTRVSFPLPSVADKDVQAFEHEHLEVR